jgi:uncharacterized protein
MSDATAPREPSMEEILATIKRIIADEAPLSAASAGANDVLELTEVVDPDGTLRHLPPIVAPRLSGAAEPPAPDGRIEPAPPSPEARSEGPGAAEAGRLLSNDAAGAAAAAFARLAAVPRERRRDSELPLSAGGGRTLEDVVRDLLRPMLQSWLDENLPGLVEQLVRVELARIVHEANAH